jgi:hypothetical protein
MFTAESVDDTVGRLRAKGAELVGEAAQYEDKYRLSKTTPVTIFCATDVLTRPLGERLQPHASS